MKINGRWMTATTLAGVMLVLAGCGGEPTRREVTRVDPRVIADEDYRFDDEDARQVYQAMVDDTLYRGWIDQWIIDHTDRPVLIVGEVENHTEDYMDPALFTRAFTRELQNTGRVRVVASPGVRDQVREERQEGQEWSSPDTRKRLRMELGADLMLLGDVRDVTERSIDGRNIIKFYQVNLDLVDLETNEIAWSGGHEIKKIVRIR